MRSFLVSHHGADKIRERKIPFGDIPDLNDLSKRGSFKVVKKVGRRELAAVYSVTSDCVILKTAYWRSK